MEDNNIMGNFNLGINWNNIFTGSDWEIYSIDGHISDLKEPEKQIELAMNFLFPDRIVLQGRKHFHGIFLEDFSAIWAFTQQCLFERTKEGNKVILYRTISNFGIGETSSIYRLSFDYMQESNLKHYELTSRDKPYSLVEKIGKYLTKILDNL